jgi:flagellar motility protein MotE (MotC chaperone)
MEELEATREAIKEWVSKREKFARGARETVVEIYSKMRPDAAAGRMEQLEGGLAAAILLKLKPRTAGVILNEMSAEKAALLTGIMAAAANTDERT